MYNIIILHKKSIYSFKQLKEKANGTPFAQSLATLILHFIPIDSTFNPVRMIHLPNTPTNENEG